MDLASNNQSKSTQTCSSTTSIDPSKSPLTKQIGLATVSQYELYIALAIDALKAQDLRSLKAVKDLYQNLSPAHKFLTFLI